MKNITKNSLELKINKKSKGIAADWNFAMKQANTKYVTLAHQDDIYFPEYSKIVVESLNNQQDSLIAYTNYQEIVHKNGTSFTRNLTLNLIIKDVLNHMNYLGTDVIRQNKTKLLKFGNPVGCPTVAYNRSNIKNFYFSPDFSINMDWFAWYQLSQQKGSFIWINKPLVHHRIHADSETSRGLSQNRRQAEDEIMFEILWPKYAAKFITHIYSLSYYSNWFLT